MANPFNLFATPESTQQFQLKTPQQQGLQNQTISGAGNLLQQLMGGGGFNFAPLAQQARTQFQTQTIPGLAERFTAFQGGQGGQRSSAFQGALGSAGAGLEQGLASDAARFGLKQQGLNQDLLSMLLGAGQQQSFVNNFRPRQPGLLERLLIGGAANMQQYAPQIISALAGIPMFGGGGGQQQSGNNNMFALSGGFNPNMGFGQQDFAGSFGRDLSF